MQLYLVRHGQSQNNAGNSSVHDVPLTPLGHKQIHRAADTLKGHHFDALYCSPLERACQTALILHSELQIAPYVHPAFSEVGFCWGEPNATRDQLQSSYPPMILDPSITNNGWAPADSETEEDAYGRARKVIDWLSERHPEPDANILIVSHGRFGSIMIGCLVGVHPCGYSRFGQNNGGISRIEIADDEIWLRFLNTTGHLSDDLLT